MGTKYVDQEVWRSKWMGGGKNLAAGKKKLHSSVQCRGSGMNILDLIFENWG
jgi:hypothetical protein